MEESILKSTKKKLNVSPDDDSFDIDIIDHINTAFFHLHQLGVGPQAGFEITDDTKTWSDFLEGEENLPLRNAVKTNVYLRVRSIFDPPQQNNLTTALQQQLAESDWRVNVVREETEWVDSNPDLDAMIIDGGDPAGE